MKIPILLAFITLLFVGLTSAQTIKTSDARKLEDVEYSIKKTQKQIDSKTSYLNEMLRTYTEDHPAIKQRREELVPLNKEVMSLIAERTRLVNEKLERTLPNTLTELLKIIILQNERLLDLLNEQRSQK